MRFEERRLVRIGVILGAVVLLIPVLYLSGILVFGLSLAPAPTADTAAAPALTKEALWARAEGGRASELRSINPVSMAGYVACNEFSKAGADCSNWLPAMPGLEYLANLHVRTNGIQRNSFKGGAASMATMFRLAGGFSRENFLNTLAARAEFDRGWRGVEAAAQGYFGRPASSLTVAQAALIASRIGDLRADPWCEPAVAMARRNRVIDAMHANGAIDEAARRDAIAAPLGLIQAVCNR